LDPNTLRDMGRYTLRWPGHCEIWRTLIDLGLLQSEPVVVNSQPVDRVGFLAAALGPALQYEPHERDLALVRIEVTGSRAGRKVKIIHQMLDWRDLTTGHTAMGRTVGFTASIGVQWLGTGALAKRGLLSPVRDISLSLLKLELERRGVQITSAEI
jgi:saccharopine dehydrogenase-like NADP-dependent oxidoreductase